MNAKQLKFVKEMVKHGDKIRAYLAAYPACKSRDAARVNASKLLQNASVAASIRSQTEKIQDLVAIKVADEVKDEEKITVLTSARKQELLRQIAEGELLIPIKKPVFDSEQKKWVTIPVMEVPDHSVRIRAIEVHSRMVGDNEPLKIDHTTKGEKLIKDIDYTQLSDQVLDALIAAEIKHGPDSE